jgi:hypothetical protein
VIIKCKWGHGPTEMLYMNITKLYQCPVCGLTMTHERIERGIPSVYKTNNSLVDTLLKLADVEPYVLVHNPHGITIVEGRVSR